MCLTYLCKLCSADTRPIRKLNDKHFTSNTFILSCVFIDHHQARLWIVFYKCWLHIGVPLCLQLCQCVYLLYKYIKVWGRNSEWNKNYTWMLGMLLRTSGCVSSGVFGVLVDLQLGGLRSVCICIPDDDIEMSKHVEVYIISRDTHSFIQYSVWRQVQSLLQNDSSTQRDIALPPSNESILSCQRDTVVILIVYLLVVIRTIKDARCMH